MLIFGLPSTSDDQPGSSMDSNPIHNPSPTRKLKYLFLDYVQILMIGQAGRWTQTPSTTPLKPKKYEMLIFVLYSTSDDQSGWLMDSNPICHPSPAKKMKCSFMDYIQILMISWLVDGLEPHLPLLSRQKNEMLIFGLHSNSDDQLAGQWTQTPSATCMILVPVFVLYLCRTLVSIVPSLTSRV